MLNKERNNKMDYIVRAVAADKQIRAFAITSREMVETARQHHKQVQLQQQHLADY